MSERDKSPVRKKPNAALVTGEKVKFELMRLDKSNNMRKHIDGTVTLIPTKNPENPRFLAYADDEGLLKQLRSNYVAGRMLAYLGFDMQSMHYVVYGPVVVQRSDERVFSASDIKSLHKALGLAKFQGECAAYDCYSADVNEDGHCCAQAECYNPLCEECVEQGNDYCEKHRPQTYAH